MTTPVIEVVSPNPSVTGVWRHLWLKYVNGFDGMQHCARCLIGPYSKRVRKDMLTNTKLTLDESTFRPDCLYLCGVAMRGGWSANLHLAFVAEAGCTAEVTASNGDRFVVHNARSLDIPDLPDGFGGLSKAFTTCRNFRFGLARYAPQPRLQASAVSGPPFGHPAK